MTLFPRIILVLILSVPTLSAHAGGAGDSKEACYDHVVTACNKAKRPELCTESGTKACDDLHKSPALEIDDIAMKEVRPGTYSLHGRATGRRQFEPIALLVARLKLSSDGQGGPAATSLPSPTGRP